MLADVVDLEGKGDVATLRAGVRLVDQDLVAQARPPGGVVPAAHGGIEPDAVPRAGPTGDENGTARLGAVLHLGRDLFRADRWPRGDI